MAFATCLVISMIVDVETIANIGYALFIQIIHV